MSELQVCGFPATAPARSAALTHGFDMFTDLNPTAMYFIEQFLTAYVGAS